MSPACAQDAIPQEGAITCSSPVAPIDSARSLKRRYGKEAAVEELAAGEGETYKGIALFPRTGDRRIEVSFAGKAMNGVTGLSIRDVAKTSRWNIAGFSIGASLADVQKANGGPFLVAGFDWDYGGYVTDWKGGALARLQPGSCRVVVRFGMDEGPSTPERLLGDGVKVSSDDATLRKWGPTVVEIGVNFSIRR